MSPRLLLSLFGTYLLGAGLVHARRNVSIDDPSPLISYAPVASWGQTAQTPLNEGGSHMLTADPSATATFSFTGVRVYFMAPLWPYDVTTALRLDDGPIILLNLTDPSRPATDGGPETAQSRVVWGSAELENRQHKFVISVGRGEQYAIVDTLIYTELENNETSSFTSGGPSSSSTPIGPTNTPSRSNNKSTVLAIALGCGLGAIALVILPVLLWLCCCGRNKGSKAKAEKSETTIAWPPNGSTTALPKYVPTTLPDSSSRHSTYSSVTETQSLPLPSTYGYTGIGASPLSRPSDTTASALHTRPAQPNQWGVQPSMADQRLYTPYQTTTLSTVTEASGPAQSSFGSRASPYNSYYSSAPPMSPPEPRAADELRYSGVPEPMGSSQGSQRTSAYAPGMAPSHSQQSDGTGSTGTAPSLPSKKSDLVYMTYDGPQDYVTPGAPKTGPPAYMR